MIELTYYLHLSMSWLSLKKYTFITTWAITEKLGSKEDWKNTQKRYADSVLLRKIWQWLLQLIYVDRWLGLQSDFFLSATKTLQLVFYCYFSSSSVVWNRKISVALVDPFRYVWPLSSQLVASDIYDVCRFS